MIREVLLKINYIQTPLLTYHSLSIKTVLGSKRVTPIRPALTNHHYLQEVYVLSFYQRHFIAVYKYTSHTQHQTIPPFLHLLGENKRTKERRYIVLYGVVKKNRNKLLHLPFSRMAQKKIRKGLEDQKFFKYLFLVFDFYNSSFQYSNKTID